MLSPKLFFITGSDLELKTFYDTEVEELVTAWGGVEIKSVDMQIKYRIFTHVYYSSQEQ